MKDGLVETLHADIRAMTVDFRLRPGERINEVALSRQLHASRTPLREALNRLVAEGFLSFEAGRGFFCRKYSVSDVHNLYQLRQAVERFAVERAVDQASDAELSELDAFLARTGDGEEKSLEDLLAFDEYFHETIAMFTRNDEIVRTLGNINARIRFFRWVDMESRRDRTQSEHRDILQALMAREAGRATELVDRHICRRRDEIADAVKECHARLFVDDEFVPPSFKTREQTCA